MTGIEKELIESLKKGNPKSFELVFKTYYSRLCTYAFDFTRQLETAEDLVKDFFLNFWINREKLEIKTSLSGYLFRSVHNQCLNYLEREKKKKLEISSDNLYLFELKLRQPLSNDYPIGSLLAKEMESQIEEIIENLPEQCREIFKLSRFDELPHKKIAEKLNISENTVKVQIYRALKKIKEAIPFIFALIFSFFSN
jgi:RNA polymerase sigma-70 factor (ECF subfamily)